VSPDPNPSPLPTRPFLLGALVASVFALGVGLRGAGVVTLPLGPDAGLWSIAALVRSTGASVSCPPLFPTLLGALGPEPVVPGSILLNAAAVGLAALLAGICSARLLATPRSRALAMVGGAALASSGAHLWTYAWFIQPECLTGAALVLTAWAGLRATQSPSPGRFLCWGGAAGLALSAREHGLVVALLVPVATLLLPGTIRERLGRLLLVLLGLQLSSGLVSGELLSPVFFGNGSLDKSGSALKDSLALAAGSLLPSAGPPDMSADFRADAQGIGLIPSMIWRGLSISGPERPLLLGGLVGLGSLFASGRRREALALGVPMATLLPAALVWTQWRHYLVLGPTAVVALVGGGLAAWEGPLGQRFRAGAGGGRLRAVLAGDRLPTLVLGLLVLGGLPWSWAQLQSMAERARTDQAALGEIDLVATWVREHAEPDSLFAGETRAGALIGLLPSPVAPRRPDVPQTWPDPAWRTWIVSRERVILQAPWVEVFAAGDWKVYRARPSGGPAMGVSTACLYGLPLYPLGDGYPGGHPAPLLEPAPGCAAGPAVPQTGPPPRLPPPPPPPRP
jgi:hypothetical protein